MYSQLCPAEDTTELDELQAHLETLKLQYNSLEAEVQNLSTLKEQHTITREAAVGKKHELLTQKRAAVAAIKKYQQSLVTKGKLIAVLQRLTYHLCSFTLKKTLLVELK